MKRKKSVVVVAAVSAGVALGWFAKSRADFVPPAGAQLAYSGTIVAQSNGAPLTGPHDVELTLLGAADGSQCTAGSTTTQFVRGRFTVPLSDQCASLLRKNPGATVDVSVDGTDFGAQQTTAVPYALQVESSHEWTSYVPNVFLTDDVPAASNSIDTTASQALFRQVGDTIELEIRTKFASDPGTGDIGWTLPTGFTPNLSKMPSQHGAVVGWATVAAAGNLVFLNCKVPNSFNQVKCEDATGFITDADVGTGFVNIHVRIPVQ